jgi:YVTN family beta-propeller protein
MKMAIGLALLLLACAPANAVQAPAASPSGTLLIGNKGENSLSFVDLATGRELGRAPTGPMPHEIAVSRDGRQAAVVAYGGATIDIFDIAARARVRTIDLSPNAGPHGIAWLADGRILATTERSRSLAIVDTGRGDAVGAILTGQEGTHMVAVAPDGRTAYTANMNSGTISILDLAAGTKLRDISVGGTPEGIALSPDGRTLWVGDNAGARLLAFDTAGLRGDAATFAPVVNISYEVSGGDAAEVRSAVAAPLERALRAWPGAERVETRLAGNGGWTQVTLAPGSAAPAMDEVVMRLRALAGGFPVGRTEIVPRILSTAPLATVTVGPVPIRVAVSPDGRWVVASNFGAGTLSVIDAATRNVARTLAVSGAREAGQVTILFSADGRRLYVAETGRNRIAEVDMEVGAVLRRLPAGAQGDGLAVAP